MATKQIPDLSPTNVANNTDLLMIRQGVEDHQVEVRYIRNEGSDVGKSMVVGEFGIGDSSKPITEYFADNDANLINRTGVYLADIDTDNVPAVGTIFHEQLVAGSTATQILIETGTNKQWFRRRNVSWFSWEQVLVASDNLASVGDAAAARTNLNVYDKPTVYTKVEADAKYPTKANNLSDLVSASAARTNLAVYSKAEADGKYMFRANNLSDLTLPATARTNLDVYAKADVYTKAETDDKYPTKANNLSDLASAATARTNLAVYSKAETDAKYLFKANNLSDLAVPATARTNLDVYAKADVYTKTEADNKYPTKANNLSDLVDAAVARTNLSVYSKSETDAKYLFKANNLSDVADPAVARTNLGIYGQADVYTKAESDAKYPTKANNLSDLQSASSARSNLDVYARSQVDSRIQALYPVGSIFMATVSTNPATLLGFGTWQKYATGRVIIGEGNGVDSNGEGKTFSNQEQGGEYRHALTGSENGPHSHPNSLNDPGHSHSYTWREPPRREDAGGGKTAADWPLTTQGGTTGSSTTNITISNASSGSGSPHNNIQPYIATYIWTRIG